MQIKSNPCKICSSIYHTAAFCPTKQRKPLQRTVIKKTVSKSTKIKKLTRAKAKENAWNAFSKYIRHRDSLATTGTIEYCICITCNERGDSSWKPYKSIQAGHAIGGRGNAVLFHEEIVWGQCGYCNQKPPYGLGGDYGNYAIALIKKYGLEHVETLQSLKGTELKYTLNDFIEIEQRYKEKLAILLSE